MPMTREAIGFDRTGPGSSTPVLLLHAGIADRRMWQPQWERLGNSYDLVRMDLRGFGDSDVAPPQRLDHVADVAATLAELGIARAHVVAASLGAGVAVELAIQHPALVESLLLAPPGGALLSELTPDLEDFIDAERAALAADDLDAAVEANITAWVVGRGRRPEALDPAVLDGVRQMQRRAFEIESDWDEVQEESMEPPALMRLPEVQARTLVLLGRLDMETSYAAARRVSAGVRGARREDWDDVAHLPSMERPEEFAALMRDWLSQG